jgi:hypothetical protein
MTRWVPDAADAAPWIANNSFDPVSPRGKFFIKSPLAVAAMGAAPLPAAFTPY